jgi:hypothetical protein
MDSFAAVLMTLGCSITVQSPKIIMTGLKLIPLTFSFETNLWGQLQNVLIYLGMFEDLISLS